MPALLIRIANGNWAATVANTNITYSFQGATLSEQGAAVRLLANTMQQGESNLVAGIDDIFVLAPGVDEHAVVQSVFGGSDGIFYIDRIIFSDADAMLIEVLDDAADALLTALG